MAELSGTALTHLQTAAAAGLVICLVMAGAFATLGFVTTGEQSRRQASLDADRLARISALLREAEGARPAPLPTVEPSAPEPSVPEPIEIEVLASAEPEGSPDEAASGEPTAEESLIAEGTLADLFAAAGPLPEAPPEAAAILTPPPRRLARAEAAAIAAALADQAGGFSVEVVTAPEAEARLYALQLTGALRGAGIDARGPVAVLTTTQADGLLVSTEADGDGPGAAVLAALQGAGLTALPTPPGTAEGDVLAPDGTDVRVYVGGLRPEPAAPAAPQPRVLEDA